MLRSLALLVCLILAPTARAATPRPAQPAANPPIYIAFLWHMHQPIYWPYETVVQTDANARYGYSVRDIHDQRTGPYTTWPWNAVQKGVAAGLPHFGTQVSFSGSLMENLDNLAAAGDGNFASWNSAYGAGHAATTSLGHPRIDLVGFGYHHPLMGLIDTWDIRKQVAAHRSMAQSHFGGVASHGIFPPENAFTPRMIPALAAENLQWVLVDNVHFDRAAAGYPWSAGGNLVEPNLADVRDANPNDWVQLNNVWAPTRISGGWGHRPHWVQYRDPATGTVSKIVAVPGDRYMGNEDGRGGFGALQYDAVISQVAPYNTDPAHPLLVVLPHDGDNYGGGTDGYYGSNFQAFVDWLAANPSRFVCTTIEDYLQMFPPDPNDVIHVENGSWSGADNGDPEFKKWLGDPAAGYSPDRNSWAVVTAAKNVVQTAEQVAPNAAGTTTALHWLLNAEASDYWYWDGSQGGVWDSHPTRAANQAVAAAQPVAAGGADLTGPTIFVPQREPYNPGGAEWGVAQPSAFEVWSYAYDVSGLANVTLQYRLDADGALPVDSPANDTYAGGAGVGAWTAAPMASSDVAATTNPLPTVHALRWGATITGLSNALVDYYVEATDSHGNASRSPIQHVWVGTGGGGGGPTGVSYAPAAPTVDDSIRITVAGANQPGSLHWGVNTWMLPVAAYRPPGTTLFNGTGPAVETPMNLVNGDLVLTLGPFHEASQAVTKLDFVIHYASGAYDNNGGADWHVTISGGAPPAKVFTIDGTLDPGATLVATSGGVDLYADWNGAELYLATQAAQGAGKDVFLYVAGAPGALRAAMWAKAGQVANWSAFVGNESANNWCGWFDQAGAAAQAAGAMLEAKLDLAQELGSVPATVYVAAARYATADGGALQGQAPAGNGDANVDAGEYAAFPIALLAAPVAGGDRTRLAPVIPMPVRDGARVRWTLARTGEARVDVYDAQGRRVARLADGVQAAGPHEARLDAAGLGTGVYFVRLSAGATRSTQRLVVMR